MRPCATGSSPASTLRRLVFPAPLRPTRPTLSPGNSEKEAPATTTRPATSTVSSFTCSKEDLDLRRTDLHGTWSRLWIEWVRRRHAPGDVGAFARPEIAGAHEPVL